MIETDYKFSEVHPLAGQIESGNDRVRFKNIISTPSGGVSLLAFKAGQALAEHLAPAELMVTVLEGEIDFNVAGKPHTLHTGDFMLVGEGVVHSVTATADSKVMLTKLKA